jgi:hypothetical protein
MAESSDTLESVRIYNSLRNGLTKLLNGIGFIVLSI